MLMLFAPQNVTSGCIKGLREKFLGSLSLTIFYGPLVNAIIRQLALR